MAARRTTAELLAENAKQRAEVLRKDEERKAKRLAKIDELDRDLVEQIKVREDKRAVLKIERDEITTSTAVLEEV